MVAQWLFVNKNPNNSMKNDGQYFAVSYIMKLYTFYGKLGHTQMNPLASYAWCIHADLESNNVDYKNRMLWGILPDVQRIQHRSRGIANR